MAPSKIRKAIGVVKDHTSIGLAVVVSGNSQLDLEVAIIKATRHEESPPHERYMREIICLTSFSRPMVSTCIAVIAKRLNKTSNWVVALKTLMLVHRLINDGDRMYEEQIFFAKRDGVRFLSMSGFRDSTNSKEYTTFVRMYALYLDEQLEFRVQFCKRKNGRYVYQGDDDDERQIIVAHGSASSKEIVVRATPVHHMSNEDILAKAQHLLQLFERFLACRPTGAAKGNKVVSAALYTALKESFKIFYDMTEVTAALIDRFMQLQVPDMIKVHGIFSFIGKQYDELCAFYDWCKSIGIMRPSKFPNIEKIPKEKLDSMCDFIRQKTEMLQNRNIVSNQNEMNPKPVEEADDTKPNKDEHVMKALSVVSVESTENKDEKTFKVMKTDKENKIQDMGDLLNLGEDAPDTDQHGQMLALALFDGLTTTVPESSINPWEAFKDSSDDWETKLVQSASYLSNVRTDLPGGFDTLMLDGMYQLEAMTQVVAYSGNGGSASSTAFGSNGKTAMLALPAPPKVNDGARSTPKTDPFAASLAIAPPASVQISEMEKKQRLLVEEQLYWQQYARDGMQGQVALANVRQQYPYQYVTGGCTQAW